MLEQCMMLWRLIQQPAMAWSCQAGKADSATAFLPAPLCCALCRIPQPQGCSFHDAERQPLTGQVPACVWGSGRGAASCLALFNPALV